MILDDEVRIRLLETSFVYAVYRQGLEIEWAEVPLREEPDPVMEGHYYGGSQAMD